MTLKLYRPDSPKPVSQAAAEALCAEWALADDQRRELGRQADGLARRQKQIEEELGRFVQARAPSGPMTVTLKWWRLSIVQVPRSFSALTELVARIGQEAVEKLKSQTGTRDKLVIELARPPAAAAANGRRKKAA